MTIKGDELSRTPVSDAVKRRVLHAHCPWHQADLENVSH